MSSYLTVTLQLKKSSKAGSSRLERTVSRGPHNGRINEQLLVDLPSSKNVILKISHNATFINVFGQHPSVSSVNQIGHLLIKKMAARYMVDIKLHRVAN